MSEFKEKYGDIEQLVIRVGKACNFKCNFCNVSDNERNVKQREGINDIIRNFHYKLKYSEYKNNKIIVTISGGEPSIFQKETIFILKYVKSFFEKKGVDVMFEIQTNASNIDINFAKIIKENGVSFALVSFHTHIEEIFNKVIGVNYDKNFYKILDGIHNLHLAGIIVDINSIISNENRHTFFDTIKYIYNSLPFVRNYNIGVIQPHGEAIKNSYILPKYKDIYRDYNQVIFFLKNNNLEVTSHFVGLPACYIESFSNSIEVYENTLFRRSFNFNEKYLINKINDNNKIQTLDCQKCLYNNVCSGIWKEYVGLQTLNPVKYKIDKFNNLRNEKNTFWYKLENTNENLKRIYDRNVRQIIIETSLGNKEEIFNLLKKSTIIGFYKVTLLIDSDFFLEEDIFLTGVSNIQIKYGNISKDFMDKLNDFSKKNSPQFRIDLDFL